MVAKHRSENFLNLLGIYTSYSILYGWLRVALSFSCYTAVVLLKCGRDKWNIYFCHVHQSRALTHLMHSRLPHLGNTFKSVSQKELLFVNSTHRYAAITHYILLFTVLSGESANAVPHYHKLCNRDSHIWGIRTGQHSRSAMAEPRYGWTTLLIMVSPLPGKYELYTGRAVHTLPRVLMWVTVA